MNRGPIADPALFVNRELSWLAFNERVLEEAGDPAVPLLERLKFAAIAAANIDEFFMVRVAGLMELVEEGETAPDLAGLSPTAQLTAVRERAQRFIATLYRIVGDELLPALKEAGIHLTPLSELDGTRQAALATYFRDAVLPVLTPLAIDFARPFPLLSSLSLNLALLLEPAAGQSARRLAIVQVPPGLSRLVQIAGTEDRSFVLLDDIIRTHLSQLFPGQAIVEAAAVRLARDAELALDDEGGRTQLEAVEREVRRRRVNDVVRLEVEAAASNELVDVLRTRLDLDETDVYRVPGFLDLRVLFALADQPGFDALRDPPLQPVDVLAGERRVDLFEVLDGRDVLLHHPYDAYEPVLALLARAAEDPEVLAIKLTLYRTSPGSPVIASLRRAAECQKQVTVLVELTARFDEERNIQWARSLEAAGAHVIYGVRGYKTHAKICLIVRRGPQGLRRYVHLGTGNYNERTARVYTDFGLMTSAESIARDATAFFTALTGYSDPPRLKKLVMAPTGLRERFVKLIQRERRRAEAGHSALIEAKVNSLIDEQIILELYAASQAGVTIRLNVRGICALRPGVPGVSATIEVVSVVDRFLEHSRIYYFHNAGEDEVYLSSADWMTRNLDRRIELLFPVRHPDDRERVVSALRAMFRDNVKGRRLLPDGTYERIRPREGEEPFRAQEALQADAARRVSLARRRAGVLFEPAT